MGKKITIEYIEGYEPEDLLEKALKTLRLEREKGKLDDPYLRYLQEYSNEIFDKVMVAMNEDILEVLYTDRRLKKSKKCEGITFAVNKS